jgi:hypothetical protein
MLGADGVRPVEVRDGPSNAHFPHTRADSDSFSTAADSNRVPASHRLDTHRPACDHDCQRSPAIIDKISTGRHTSSVPLDTPVKGCEEPDR